MCTLPVHTSAVLRKTRVVPMYRMFWLVGCMAITPVQGLPPLRPPVFWTQVLPPSTDLWTTVFWNSSYIVRGSVGLMAK